MGKKTMGKKTMGKKIMGNKTMGKKLGTCHRQCLLHLFYPGEGGIYIEACSAPLKNSMERKGWRRTGENADISSAGNRHTAREGLSYLRSGITFSRGR